MLLNETLKQLPDAESWYRKLGDTPIRVAKTCWREQQILVSNTPREPVHELEQYYEFRAVLTFDRVFDWELILSR